ncbi:Ig-like domain-containing protein, partial [Pseudomonas sp. JAI115]|uniref:Ig-like domain-containing protein n=1 Tax=Pseudomonas sp. JAI115 TaxID=2723061 RepID=UPI001620263B
FIADTGTATILLVADKTEAVANGKDVVKVTATARDAHNNLILTGVDLSVAVNVGNIKINGGAIAKVKTGRDGKVEMNWTSTTAKFPVEQDPAVITASWKDGAKSTETKVGFHPDISTAEILTTVTPGYVKADGVSQAKVYVKFVDRNRNPFKGYAVYLEPQGAYTGIKFPPAVMTNSLGDAELSLSSTSVAELSFKMQSQINVSSETKKIIFERPIEVTGWKKDVLWRYVKSVCPSGSRVANYAEYESYERTGGRPVLVGGDNEYWTSSYNDKTAYVHVFNRGKHEVYLPGKGPGSGIGGWDGDSMRFAMCVKKQ